jgi:hypothetical protein
MIGRSAEDNAQFVAREVLEPKDCRIVIGEAD